jgi:EAL domain-containing protein (putative c-di-GMP-specific phosphodiesterase class I)
MDMQAAAVGVETQAQMAFLQDEECDAMQGYLIAPPLLGVEEAAAYLRAVPVPGMIVEAAS